MLDHGIALFVPPSLKQVLYQESYDEFMHKKSPVKPTSHCWSAQQNLYIGCENGQLLLIDFETGVVNILTNPEITVCSGYIMNLFIALVIFLSRFSRKAVY